jgi:DNA-binding HxlR family transcriptional regulator
MKDLPDWCAGENWCPVTATASVLSGKWHPVIVHRLLEFESMGFNEIKDELKISSKVLSENLTNLQEKDIVEKEVLQEQPKRVEYCLTDKGESLRPVVESMADWGNKNLK